jgi:hypothetical protein
MDDSIVLSDAVYEAVAEEQATRKEEVTTVERMLEVWDQNNWCDCCAPYKKSAWPDRHKEFELADKHPEEAGGWFAELYKHMCGKSHIAHEFGISAKELADYIELKEIVDFL